MYDSDSFNSYIMNISELRDQLEAVGYPIDDKELVTIALNGLPSSWEPFIQGLCAWKKPTKFDKLWALCVQEETKSRNKFEKPQHEDQALDTHARREKGRRFEKRNSNRRQNSATDQESKKKDISHIQCFRCDNFCHFAVNCLQKKRRHESAAYVDEEPPLERPSLEDYEEYVL